MVVLASHCPKILIDLLRLFLQPRSEAAMFSACSRWLGDDAMSVASGSFSRLAQPTQQPCVDYIPIDTLSHLKISCYLWLKRVVAPPTGGSA